ILEEVVLEPVVVAVDLAVAGYQHQRITAPRRHIDEARQDEAVDEGRRRVGRDRIERYGARQRPLVEDHREGAAARQWYPVGEARIDRAGRLLRAQDRELQPGVGTRLQRRQIDRRFGQPDPLWATAEGVLEPANAPGDLGVPVALSRQRQDRVVETLHDRV